MITEIYQPMKALLGLLQQLRDDKEAGQIHIRLLCLEFERNASLLKALKLDTGSQTRTVILRAIDLLETTVLELVFLSPPAAGKFFDLLKDEVVITKDLDGAMSKKPNNKLLAVFGRIIVRISTMKKLATLFSEQSSTSLKAIQFRTRCQNLLKDIVAIRKSLRRHGAMKDLV